MKIVNWRDWSLRCDEEATEKAYSAVSDSEGCTCNGCRNYVRARESLFPAEILRLFSELRVDLRKEAEAGQVHRVRPGVHLYLVWYHFVGNVVSGKPPSVLCPDTVTETLRIGFREDRSVAHSVFVGQPLVQIDLEVEVPWVLDDPEPE